MFDTLAMGGNPSAWLVVLLIVALLFGSQRIPEIMRGLGSGMKEFKKGLEEEQNEEKATSPSDSPEGEK